LEIQCSDQPDGCNLPSAPAPGGKQLAGGVVGGLDSIESAQIFTDREGDELLPQHAERDAAQGEHALRLYVLITQMSHTAACTYFHEIEPRLAGWLLMAHDRVHADHFHLTHECLAELLGVRRSGVTIAAGALQQRGFINYARGDIHILDRPGLETASCTCYDTLRADYTRLLP
jgi:hypothetical protein